MRGVLRKAIIAFAVTSLVMSVLLAIQSIDAIGTDASYAGFYNPDEFYCGPLGIAACVLAAVCAGRLRRPGWAAVLACVAAAGFVEECVFLGISLGAFDSGLSQTTYVALGIIGYARQVLLPVAALLALRLRPAQRDTPDLSADKSAGSDGAPPVVAGT
jgi:hypothetical protein